MKTVFRKEVEYPLSLYPLDVESHHEWDLYWRGRPLPSPSWEVWRERFAPWIELFRERGLNSLLFVGNGLSPEPQLFSYAGFQSVSLELSGVANQSAAQWSFPNHGEEVCPSCETQSSCWLASIESGSKKAKFVTGSMFDAHACSGPFDVLVIRRTLHLFQGRRLHEALRRLRERLRPGGVLIVEIHFDQRAYQTLCQLLPRYQWIVRDPQHSDSTGWTADILFTS